MQKTIDSTNYRRTKQLKYNEEHGITPQAIVKPSLEIVGYDKKEAVKPKKQYYAGPGEADVAADPVVQYMSVDALEHAIAKTHKEMGKAAKELDFIEAARLRDEMYKLQELLIKHQNKS